jgi:hypothetical protein
MKLPTDCRHPAQTSLLLACCAVVLGALASCVNQGNSGSGASSVGSEQFRDVIVPAGLRLQNDAHQSYALEAASWRHGRYVYLGRVRMDDAVAYIKQRAPQHNWQVVGESGANDPQTMLRLERKPHTATYSFTLSGGQLTMMVDYRTDYGAPQ